MIQFSHCADICFGIEEAMLASTSWACDPIVILNKGIHESHISRGYSNVRNTYPCDAENPFKNIVERELPEKAVIIMNHQ